MDNFLKTMDILPVLKKSKSQNGGCDCSKIAKQIRNNSFVLASSSADVLEEKLRKW